MQLSQPTLPAELAGGARTLPQHTSGNRPENTLRLSVTERCNFACRYCMPLEGIPKISYEELPSLSELSSAVKWLVCEQKVRRVRITGGEPLVRPGLVERVRDISQIPGVKEVSLTTNGSRLAEMAEPLRRAGLRRVNVSLDTVDPVRFNELTRGRLEPVLAGIEAVVEAGLTPVKLNAVLRRSSWREDVPALLEYAGKKGVELRFIELMKTGATAEWAVAEYVSADEVKEWLDGISEVTAIGGEASAPARLTVVEWVGRQVKVGWITALSHPFCDNCNRLRLDSYGRLRRCLMDPVSLPLLELLKVASAAEVREKVDGYLIAKHAPEFMVNEQAMVSVGG
jgi:cyclic pyranopterin phosphate synthase